MANGEKLPQHVTAPQAHRRPVHNVSGNQAFQPESPEQLSPLQALGQKILPPRPQASADSASRIQSLDTRQFVEQAYAIYGQPLLHYLQKMVGNQEIAEDLLQDLWVRTLNNPLKNSNSLRSYLYTIATNLAFDYLRHKKLIIFVSYEEVTTTSENDRQSNDAFHKVTAATRSDGFEDSAVASLTVQNTLRRMDDDSYNKYAAALLMYYDQGLAYSEIAAVIGISEGGVKMYLSRARKMFRKLYSEETQEE